MENKRQRQVAKIIQKDLGAIFQKDLKDILKGAFVTITDVKVTPDLGIARAYLSFMMVTDKEELLERIRDSSKKIRAIFGNQARHQFRVIPNFQFYIDDTAEYAQKMNELFQGLEIPPESEENPDIYNR